MQRSGETIDIVLGLGSNLGAQLAMLRAAADGIASLVSPTAAPRDRSARCDTLVVMARSRVVQSAPAGGPPQPDYLNAALLVRTTLTPHELLALTSGLEQRLGRARPDRVRWGPRVIDIDLLWARGRVVETPELRLPHPRLRERSFALVPLLDVVPDAADPSRGDSYASLPAAKEPLAVVATL